MNNDDLEEISPKDKRYLGVMLATFSLFAVATILWNYDGDPYGMWHVEPDKNLDLFSHTRLHKPYRMRNVQATKLILGSSRAGRIPIDKASGEARAYNAAHPGTTLYEIYRQLEHGDVITPLESVILGLDYYMFRDDHEKLLFSDFDDRLDRSDSNLYTTVARHKQRITDFWNILLSRSAILASHNTKSNTQISNRRFFPTGDWETIRGIFTSRQLFDILGKQKLKEFTELSSVLNTEYFEKILEYCLQSSISIDIVISPIHAYQMAVIERTGQWKNYVEYQRTVVQIAESFRKRGLEIRVWGFEHHEALVHDSMIEPVWFDDGIHYNRASAKEIVYCLWEAPSNSCDSPLKPRELQSSTLEQYFATVDNLRHTFKH